MDFTNKVAVITGASKGIGLATAKLMLEKGMKVAGWSRTQPELEHPNFHFFECDVQDFFSVSRAFRETENELGDEISLLVNNAGLGYTGKLHETELEEWHEMFDTNVHGLFYCSRLIVPRMVQQRSGYVVNIASIAATTGIAEMSAYVGTKHAVRGISHSMFKELREYGIKVSCLYPGSVDTNFFDNIPGGGQTPNKMLPTDVADTIWYLMNTSPNYHIVDVEMRPLQPKG